MLYRRSLLGIATLALALNAQAARRPGEPLKPGFNLFSRQDDVQIGQENAKQVLQQYQVVNNAFIQDYVRKVGRRLAAQPEAKNSGFEFTFTVLHVDQVNAFALPGGPMFIYTGLLKVIANEAQLAGVMGHEMAHVILRHGTHEATKANGISLLAGGLGAILGGGDTIAGKLAQAGLGLGANSVILKFSRDAESEADALGSHLMSEAGYDPIQMAKFFEKLGASGGQQLQILSDHPNPGNREAAIEAEMKTLPTRSYGFDTGQFAQVQKEVKALPPASKKPLAGVVGPGSGVPAPGSAGNSPDWREYRGQGFVIRYPVDWKAFGDDGAADVTLAPRDGIVSQNGSSQIGFGAAIGAFAPKTGRPTLRNATADLIGSLKQQNPGMTSSGSSDSATVGGASALQTTMHNTSPFGGGEIDTLVTAMHGQKLWYVIFIAPERDQPRVEHSFKQMIESIRFTE